jgi:aspartate/methionine/tyrosine aminotransferase
MLLNSPNNPSGASLSLLIWQELAALCVRHDLWLISDEVYSDLLYEETSARRVCRAWPNARRPSTVCRNPTP